VACRRADPDNAARAELALDLIAAHDRAFRRTARRHSICADDAEDAYQRALEILLTKAPTDRPGRLAAWMHTVTKHEAMAVRRGRERLLGGSSQEAPAGSEPLLDIPAEGAGPAERAERRERVARGAEALAALKPQERRTLILKAEGFSYADIQAITGFSYTKVNRCMAEGRKRFLQLFDAIEDGRRCEELAPALAALREGGAVDGGADELRRHLRSCTRCRAAFKVRPTLQATGHDR
jgi:RNA polymerase sigma factor (sigma-70 family)